MSADFEFPPELSAALQDILTDEQISGVAGGDRVQLYPGQIAQIFQAGRDRSASTPVEATSVVEGAGETGPVDFAPAGYAEQLRASMRSWETVPEHEEPFDVSLTPYQLDPIAMLRYVLPFINNRAVDSELCRDHRLDECYINTIARRYVERAEAAAQRDNPPRPGAAAAGD